MYVAAICIDNVYKTYDTYNMVHLASKLYHCMTLTYFSMTKDIVIIAQWKETSRAHI